MFHNLFLCRIRVDQGQYFCASNHQIGDGSDRDGVGDSSLHFGVHETGSRPISARLSKQGNKKPKPNFVIEFNELVYSLFHANLDERKRRQLALRPDKLILKEVLGN